MSTQAGLAVTTSNTTCSNGLVGLENGDGTVCCVSGCEPCGGSKCAGTPGLSSDDCCAGTIEANGQLCSDTNAAPCVLDTAQTTSNTTCSSDLVGLQNNGNTVCCDSGCGQCGGSGCGNISGLSADDCCVDEIFENGELCSVALSAPCVLDAPEVEPSTCSNGLAGVENKDGTICCAEACNGQCAGVGCGSITGTNGGSDCCGDNILESGVSCEDGVEAPCIIVNGAYTDAPTASPIDSFTFGPTASPTAGSREFLGGSLSPTSTPTAESRSFFGVSLSPTPAPSARSRTGQLSAAPTAFGQTPAPATVDGISSSATLFPGVTLGPANGASTASAEIAVTLAAMAGGLFAVFSCVRK